MELLLENFSQQPLLNFAIKFNVNYLALQPDGAIKLAAAIPPGGSARYSLPLKHSSDAKDHGGAPGVVQMAIKSDLSVAYFQDSPEAYVLFDDNGRLERKSYIDLWKAIAQQNEIPREVPNRVSSASSVEQIKSRLGMFNIFYVAHRQVAGKGDVIYFSISFKQAPMLLELTVNGPSCTAIIKSENVAAASLALTSIVNLLTTAS